MDDRSVRILVADDEADLLWALQHHLHDAGYEVLTAGDGHAALQVARRHRPDLAILDVAMPGMGGMEVCRALRCDPALAAIPILFLTVRSHVDDRVSALEEGGDDYMVKPFDLRELKLRIKALLRRSQLGAPASPGTDIGSYLLTLGDVTLDLNRRQARVNDKSAQLTPAEFNILHFLMRHPDELFSSQRLFEGVWGYAPSVTGSGVVRWHVRNLRSKIETDPAHPTFIRTVARHGYVLCSSLTQS
jgi:DNA-binding response OmpR family regulator